MGSLLCETETARSMNDLCAARDQATRADMVELRLDGVADLDVAGSLAGRRKPVVATCRASWEGGRFDGSEEERHRILASAFAHGAEFVDVEWQAGFQDLVDAYPSRAVVSWHCFDQPPADLAGRVRAMRATGAAIIKVAVRTPRLTDTVPLAAIGREGGAVVIGMGDAGVPSRLLATRFGARWTYAGDGVAPGQIPAAEMLDRFRFRDIGAATRLFGVVSQSALHSLSPAMHNRAFADAGLDAVYVPLSTDSFEDFVAFADAMTVEGVSVTIPFKLDALRAAARSEGVATEVGAANTLRRGAAGWEATNTDVEGFLEPLAAAWDRSLDGVRVSVLGAGGAARAVIVALASRGAQVTVHARREEQAQELAAQFQVASGPYPPSAGSWDILVNCTPLGGAARRSESPMPADGLSGRLVYDLTYGPGEAALLRDARAAGIATLDGLAMLVAQAERQFEWWTGQKPAPGVMEAAARRRLSV